MDCLRLTRFFFTLLLVRFFLVFWFFFWLFFLVLLSLLFFTYCFSFFSGCVQFSWNMIRSRRVLLLTWGAWFATAVTRHLSANATF